MDGLAYFINSTGMFDGIDRAEYFSFRGIVLFPGCANHHPWHETYQALSYPLGKTRRGLKKWIKKTMKRYFPTVHKCSECGQDVATNFTIRFETK